MFNSKENKTNLSPENIPSHIAIIMDGNGRWASKRLLNKKAGHKEGANTLEKISKCAVKLGIKHLTVYAFSTENWKRSDEEVNGIMNLFRSYLKNHISRAKKDDVKVNIIGDIKGLDEDIQKQIIELETITKDKKGMNLHIALNYGGRDEIIRAVKDISKDILSGNISCEQINESTINSYLDTANIPDPELLIRTSGEYRISNFLLWQMAYTEFYFTDKLWPDFTENDLIEAIRVYQGVDRRFGGRNG